MRDTWLIVLVRQLWKEREPLGVVYSRAGASVRAAEFTYDWGAAEEK